MVQPNKNAGIASKYKGIHLTLGLMFCFGILLMGFDVKVEKDVSVKEQKPGLVPFFITAVVRLGE